jgi:hypothetical protein
MILFSDAAALNLDRIGCNALFVEKRHYVYSALKLDILSECVGKVKEGGSASL